MQIHSISSGGGCCCIQMMQLPFPFIRVWPICAPSRASVIVRLCVFYVEGLLPGNHTTLPLWKPQNETSYRLRLRQVERKIPSGTRYRVLTFREAELTGAKRCCKPRVGSAWNNNYITWRVTRMSFTWASNAMPAGMSSEAYQLFYMTGDITSQALDHQQRSQAALPQFCALMERLLNLQSINFYDKLFSSNWLSIINQWVSFNPWGKCFIVDVPPKLQSYDNGLFKSCLIMSSLFVLFFKF